MTWLDADRLLCTDSGSPVVSVQLPGGARLPACLGSTINNHCTVHITTYLGSLCPVSWSSQPYLPLISVRTQVLSQ